MKKWIVILLSVLILCAVSFALADVSIDATNFPDENFRNFVSQHYGTNGTLTTQTISSTTEMDCSNADIGSLEGIQNFTALTKLNCSDNDNLSDLGCLASLTSLTDLNCNRAFYLSDSSFTRSLTNLVKFDCSNTDLGDIAGLTGMTRLSELRCEYCDNINSLDFSHCTELTYLDCRYVHMETIDLTQCTKLAYLDCQWSRVSTLNVRNLPLLKEIHCNNNDLTAIDFSGCTALTSFDASQCMYLKSIDLTGCSSLASYSYDESGSGFILETLSVKNCTGLKELNCHGGQVEIDVSGCTSLEKLDCQWCPMNNGLDVTGCPALKELYCNDTNTSSLDVSKCPKLEKLSFYTTYIQDVDISNCPVLCEAVRNYQRQSTSDYDYYGEADNPVIRLSPDQTVSGAGEGLGRIDLSGAVIAEIKAQTYTGKAIKPKLTVTLSGRSLTLNEDYTVSYKNNKKVGKATATITGKGNYSGTKSAVFTIVPKKVKLSSLKAGKKALTVKWKAGKGIDGYEIEYSLKEDFAGAQKVTVSKANTTEYKISKLKAKKKYYVRIRSYKKVKGKKYYSKWSSVLKKKTK